MSGATTLSFVEYLEQCGLLDDKAVGQLRNITQDKSDSAFAVASRTGMISEQALVNAFAGYTGWPILSFPELSSMEPQIIEALEVLQLQTSWCQHEGLVPWIANDQLVCCTCDLLSRSAQEVLRIKSSQLGKSLSCRIVRSVDLDNLFASITSQKATAVVSTGDLAHLRELAEEGPIVELVNGLLSQAVTRRASDIHIEPGEYGFVSRVRVDGVMRDLQKFSADRFDATVCRIKILSQLDIAERRLPQDGRMTARIHGEVFDVRVSVLPCSNGESVVMRLLHQDRPDYNLADLGMLDDHSAQFRRWIDAPNGIVLVTGPTGSGKTTTLYTALDLGNDGLKKIITVEDPVEYKLEGITQLQVNSDIGYTFAAALRSILRHDPDVILIGEIRDKETAAIAVQSALTGHLVFSTLHTNSAAGAVTRLGDMGVEKFLLASSLRGIMAQRLVRRLCPHCSRPIVLENSAHQAMLQDALAHFKASDPKAPLGTQDIHLSEPVGCDVCLHTGYLGRIALYEMFDVDETIRQQILDQVSETQMIQDLRSRNVRSMTQDGFLKVCAGITTVSEVMTVGQ
ncbi:MAG: GspE/PulE family protein [Hydrogenophaga sp.]|uniref:GspE/PulE family protein n=1 Tax=Hydrogenophaga sp. TaxID=1904254 RepID=UPI002ABD0BDE|nr:GspE/PulE family protein [Hydrogenophaga sp.]MDZ4187686.1 GspE/PulE family protein [Hydrogenophaga sp.]